MDVVPGERYPPDITIPLREGECHSRQGVESDEGLLWLDAEPVDLPTGSGSLPVPQGQSVCNTIDLPTTLYLASSAGDQTH